MWTQWLERTLRKRPQKIAADDVEIAVEPSAPRTDDLRVVASAAEHSPADCLAAAEGGE